MKEKRNDLTPPYFRYMVNLIRPFPDFDFSFIEPVRRLATLFRVEQRVWRKPIR